MQFSILEIEERIFRLPINDENQETFIQLLELPYDIFKPIIDMLLREEITIEDLQDKINTVKDSLIKSNYSYYANQNAGTYLSEESVKSELKNILKGVPPTFIPVIYDNSTEGSNSGNIDALGKANYSVQSLDFNSNSPDPLERSNTTSLTEAKKQQQQQFASKRNVLT